MKDEDIRYTISKNDMTVMMSMAFALGSRKETSEEAIAKLEQHFNSLYISGYITSNEPEDEED